MQHINQICTLIKANGGTAYFVGGHVRDKILGRESKDVDIEVFNIDPTTLKTILEGFGPVNEVGMSFGILKLRPNDKGDIDFALPRRENKAGRGHKGFIAQVDPSMTVKEAASRRDFTINSIYKDVLTGEIIDHYEGVQHLGARKLVAVSEHYAEDPLRVLRGMQLASRFGLSMDCPSLTAEMSESMKTEYNSLPIERIGEEWRKWAKGDNPFNGIETLVRTNWLELYPEIFNMAGVEQDPTFHPEGCCLTHTGLVCDAMADICKRQSITGEDREVFMFAALCHDMGKPETTVFERGRWRSPGHAQAGVPIAEKFLKSIGIYQRTIDRVLPLVAEHMYPSWEKQTRRAIQRLKVRLGIATLDELLLVMEADMSGRAPLPACKPEGYERMVELNQELPPKIEPIIDGRDIINADSNIAGKMIGVVKQAAFEAQLDEQFTNKADGLVWLDKFIKTNYYKEI